MNDVDDVEDEDLDLIKPSDIKKWVDEEISTRVKYSYEPTLIVMSHNALDLFEKYLKDYLRYDTVDDDKKEYRGIPIKVLDGVEWYYVNVYVKDQLSWECEGIEL